MRATDGGKPSSPGRRTGTVLKHRGPHYLCPQCRDINPLHLNARRARSAVFFTVPSAARTPKPRAESRRKEGGEGVTAGRNIRRTTVLYLTLHTTGAPATSCARRVVPLVLEFSGTSGGRVGRLPRSADALEFYTRRVFYSRVNKASPRRCKRGNRNNFTCAARRAIRSPISPDGAERLSS